MTFLSDNCVVLHCLSFELHLGLASKDRSRSATKSYVSSARRVDARDEAQLRIGRFSCPMLAFDSDPKCQFVLGQIHFYKPLTLFHCFVPYEFHLK